MEIRARRPAEFQPPQGGQPAQQRVATTDPDQFPFPRRGNDDAPIVVLCDTPTIEAMRQGLPDTVDGLGYVVKIAQKHGFVQDDLLFLSLCAPMSEIDRSTAKRRWEHVKRYEGRVRQMIETVNPKVVVTCGELATRVMANRAVKITKQRGICARSPVNNRLYFPVLSPKMVRMQPDNEPILDADFGTLSRLKEGGFDPRSLNVEDVDYRYVTTLEDLIENKPRALSVDTETTGLDFRKPGFKVLTIQLSTGPGETRIVPTWDYYKRWQAEFNAKGIVMTRDQCNRLVGQAKALLEDPEIKKIATNFKYDNGALEFGLGIKVNGWNDDTELMARAVAENFMSYSLEDLVRIYVPEMSGYSDYFDGHVDKSRMIDVPPFSEYDGKGKIVRAGMLEYAGGDSDASFRLYRALYPLLRREPGQMFLYRKVQMRGLLSFAKRIEDFGQCIDRKALEAYETEVATWIKQEEQELFDLIPGDVRRKWLSDADVQKDLAKRGNRSIPDMLFGKDKFLIDVLFSKDIGFKLKPREFTPSTRKLPPDQRVPSTSTKDHLPYFVNAKGVAGEFVNRYRDYKKAKTLLSKYIVNFYKYIKPANDSNEEKIYPSYNFRTNTSRTNSQDPNGQNFPKRGGKKVDFAKGFLKLIKASDGKELIAADMSQVELRLTAWSAMEPTMLGIYNAGGDIHAATAAAVMRISDAEFAAMGGDVRKLQRFRAKAVNFGFIYGAMAKTFQTYAKTQYEVDYTEKEAEETRDAFFAKYGKLLQWHAEVEAFVKEHGFVRTLHGGFRHLPSVWSTNWSVKSEAVRQAINAPIQRMGSDLGVIAIARLAAQADPRFLRPVGFVHDQIICEVDPGYRDEAMGALCWVMENPPLEEWFGITAPLPFVADPEFGMNLAQTTEVSRRDDGTFFWEEKRGEDKIVHDMPKVRNEKPEWWNDDEEQAYDDFMANRVPIWDHLLPRADIQPPSRRRPVAA